jgi:hypothetical protein
MQSSPDGGGLSTSGKTLSQPSETLATADNDAHALVRSEGQAVPMAPLLRSFTDAWEMGLQAWQVFAGMEAGGRAGAAVAAKEDPTKRDETAGAQMADISPVLAEACMAGVASAMRYCAAVAGLGLRYEASLARTVSEGTTGRGAASPAELRARADELRALLRGVADAANLEARLLQLSLERVSEKIAEAADRATPSPHPFDRRRRHEVKP